MRVVRIVAAGCGLIGLSLVLAQEGDFSARLSTVPISPQQQASVTGLGSARAELDGRRLTVQGHFEGLQGPASAARLHLGIAMGVRGAPIHELDVEPSASGRVSGVVELSRAEAQALRDGRIYLQIDSEPAPEGNLWGWLLR
jgi:hypothetical protein